MLSIHLLKVITAQHKIAQFLVAHSVETLDRVTLREKVIDEGLRSQNACCAGAAAAAVEASTSLGADYAETLAYATSYDKSPGDSLVGYVGIVLGNKN